MAETMRITLASPAPKWNSEYSVPSGLRAANRVALPLASMDSRLQPCIFLPRTPATASMTESESTISLLATNLLPIALTSSLRSVAGTVRDTPNSKTSRGIAFRFHFSRRKLAVRCSERRLLSSLSITSYSIIQSFMLAS
jgi:hypothetical protein